MAIVVVSGALANKPLNGGEAWVRLSWVRGFQKLGFDTYLVEELATETCVDDRGQPAALERSANLVHFNCVVREFGLSDSSALVLDQGEEIHGLERDDLVELAEAADLLVNISGHLSWEHLFQRFRRRAYVDIDPGFTQFWHAQGSRGARLEDHDLHFTIGENIGTAGCTIPTCGIRWIPTRQPVVLDDWPETPGRELDRFTTVASWRGPYGRVDHDGRSYGLKVHEWRKYIELPTLSGEAFEAALHIDPAETADLELLDRNGWRLVDPRAAVPDADSFRRYIQESGAEFSVAQGIYVETWGGWFSDRTTRYLASGKPALVQDTGFSRHLPVGEGLVAFRTLDEAVEGARAIAADYASHARAARRIAEEEFDSDKVLLRVLADALP